MWKAFAFGVVVAGAIGPIALLIFATGARQGLAAGAFAGLGAALADLLYAIAVFSAGALLLPLVASHGAAIGTIAATLLIGLGVWMLIGAARAVEAPASLQPASRSFLPTFLLTVVNPMTIVIFAGIVPQLPIAGSVASATLLALALAAGSGAVNVAIGALGSALGRALPGSRARRAVSVAAALGMMAFGIAGLAGT